MAKILRPLWLKSDRLVPLNNGVSVAVPSVWLPQCSDRLRELGYNALLLGVRGEVPQESASSWIPGDIPLLIKPYFDTRGCPLDPSWRGRMIPCLDTLCRRIPNLCGIFWESGLLDPSYSSHSSASDATLADMVFEEMRILERAIDGRTRLIFYVPADKVGRQAGWISSLCDEAGGETSIAFSSVKGHPWHDHLPLHPLWEVLAASPDVSSTPLMPIVNLGMVGMGNGLWPCVPFDLFERCLARCVRHPFEGPIVLADQLPGKGGALECSLWMGAQEGSAEFLSGKWLRSRRQDLDYEAWRTLMRKTREIAIEIRSLVEQGRKQEHNRLLLDSLLARLKFLKCHFETQEKSQQLPTLFDYFCGFVCEAGTRLIESAHSLNVSLYGQTMREDAEGFWKSEVGKKIQSENSFS
ncbi:MAG: hypothetical protein LLG04_04795 [Parachlamydia sp.]|nr:hypothetical protein [Parachlamydia sp.]